jgi:hypothetical protein
MGPKIANLASHHSERDEGRHVIEMHRHFLHGCFGAMYELADNPLGRLRFTLERRGRALA